MTGNHRFITPPRINLGFMNLAGIQHELGVSARTVRRWVRAGHLPEPRRLGRCPFWSVEAVREALIRKDDGAK